MSDISDVLPSSTAVRAEPLAGRRRLPEATSMTVSMLPYLAVYVALSATGLLLLRSRLAGGASLSALPTDVWFIVGALCYGLSFLTWLAALRHFDLARAFPVFAGSSYAAVTIGAILFLGERISDRGIAGVVCIGAGILLLGR